MPSQIRVFPFGNRLALPMKEVSDHISGLAAALIRGATELGIEIKTPRDSVGPLVVLKCKNSEAMVQKLAARDIIASNRHDGLRLGLHVYNTTEDVEAVLEVLKGNLESLVLSKDVATTV